MKQSERGSTGREAGRPLLASPVAWLVAGAVLLLVVAVVKRGDSPAESGTANGVATPEVPSVAESQSPRPSPRMFGASSGPASAIPDGLSPEERARAEVTTRVASFVSNRRNVLAEFAKLHGLMVPQDVDKMLQKMESGDTEGADKIFQLLKRFNQSDDGKGAPGLREIWPVLEETYGVMNLTRKWPAQALLDYGKAVMEAVPPGAVYLGSSDAGRLIPTLMNDSTRAETSPVLNHKNLGDPNYLNLLKHQYGDRIQLPDQAELAAVLQPYSPSQGGGAVPGAASGTSMNEKILRLIMEKNPGMRFAIQDIQATPSMYQGVEISGALMFLGGGSDGSQAASAERASQGAGYWQSASERLNADPNVQNSPEARLGWAELAVAQANVLAANSKIEEAEAVFKSAAAIAPASMVPIERWAAWLAGTGRLNEAVPLAQEFARAHPENAPAVAALLTRLGVPPQQ